MERDALPTMDARQTTHSGKTFFVSLLICVPKETKNV